ncbi:MAG: phospholipid carrier-dependent glycosyltransferase [Anaerolineae bacterium]|nr:phospholipid carrier-dependent glycosyltransferase [Anaerolineae bacterium]
MFLKKYGIYLIVLIFIVLGSIYSVVTPIMEASDELWHYPVVKYIADHGSLPYQDPQVETPWRQEGSQAPLYYAISALLTCWIDTSDLPQARYLNPHGDNGIIKEDGNANLMIHGLADGFPWRGTTLAIHLIRFFSVLLGAGAVYFTYRLVLELWSDRVGLALAAASITAFNPMFCFISGSVNNDTLAMLLCAVGIWRLVRLVGRHGGEIEPVRRLWWRDVALLGAVLGAAVLTKSQAMGLLPLTALGISFVAWRRRSWWHLWSGGVVTSGLVLLVSGWWFVRNAVLYDGDWTGIERFIVILGYRDPPATLRQLWGERHGFMMAYWGLFGGVNVPLPGWTYRVLNGAVVAAAIGLVIKVASCGLRVASSRPSVKRGAQASASNGHFQPPTHNFQLFLLFLWPLLVVVLWAAWALRTWSSQGRLVFGAMSAWSTWLALGLSGLVPRNRIFRKNSVSPALLPGLLGALMLGIAAWTPWGVIAPTYRAPILPPDVDPQPQHVLRADVGGLVRLLGYDIENTSAQPGDAFRFTLYWEVLRPMDRDWSIFCHIFDLDLGLPAMMRDRFPGRGLLATSQMSPGTRWADRYVIVLPETAYAPTEAAIEVGLYDRHTQERLPIEIATGEGEVIEDRLRFQPLSVEPGPGDLPNPVHINFEDRLALVGWELDRRVAAPGDEIALTLYWECLAPMSRSYTVSAQVLDVGRKVAQWDSWPGDSDTAGWQRGQRVIDRRVLAVAPDAPAGGYDLYLILYDGQTMQRMRLINSEGRVLPDDFVVLGRVRVSGVSQ